MCDQTEVIYSPGDVVWVKLGPVWWPGQVYDYDKLPEEITANLRKKPIAVVKFFQEDSYEYVKNLNSIYHYNCRKKHEFIKKGLDMCRSNNRDVPSNMKMFPNDIATAEHLTNGDPDILNSKEFAPEEKEDYSELFGKKNPKKSKTDSLKKDNTFWRSKSLPDSSLKAGRRSLPTPTIPRPITHPRFITKALEGRSDHEVRIRQQILPVGSRSSFGSDTKQYNCHLCNFSSSRINVMVLHNKSHSAGYADAYLPPQQHSGKGRKIKHEKKLVYSSEKRPRISDVFRSEEPPSKRRSVKANSEIDESSQVVPDKSSGKVVDTPGTLLKKPVFGRKKSAKDKAEKLAKEKQQNDAFRETLLKDWDEDEDNEDDISKESDLNRKKDSADSSLNSSDKYECNSSKQKEKSCFDFDDSEDGLNIGETVMKFGQKIPRVFGDKPKKQAKTLLEDNSVNVECSNSINVEDFSSNVSSKNESSQMIPLEVAGKISEESREKEGEDLQSAFKSLLEETVVPVIPDAPTQFGGKLEKMDLETPLNQVQDGGGGGGDNSDGSGRVDLNNENSGNEISGNSDSNERVSEAHGNEAMVENEINKGIFDTISQPAVKTEYSDVKEAEGVQSSCDGEEKETSCVDSEHFLVKTSEEVATSSSDDARLEIHASPNENNVASKNETKISSLVEEVGKFSVFNKEKSEVKENSDKKEQKDRDISENVPKNISSVSCVFDTNICSGTEGILQSDVVAAEGQGRKLIDEINSFPGRNTIDKDIESDHISDVKVDLNTPISTTEENNFQEMDFDINSMPVIISEDVQGQENNISVVNKSNSSFSTSVVTNSSVSSNDAGKLITVKSIKESTLDSTGNFSAILKDDSPGSVASLGKDKTSSRKMLLSPSKVVATPRSPQVATIKVQPSVTAGTKLTVPGGLISPKNVVGNTSQVLILKSTTPGQPGKQTLQKISNTSQMIQQGGKVLILTNPQGTAGQSKVLSSLTSQQKNLTPTKLTGTRILTTKGTVLTTGSQGLISKGNILSGSSKTVTTKSGQKILINKAGVISQTPKSVIINKSGVLTSVNSSVVTGKSSFITQNILPSKSELASNPHINSSQITVSSKGATATILTSPGLSNKSMILTPVTSTKGGLLSNNQKLRLITSKGNPSASVNSGTKLMFQSSPSRMILPSSSLTKNQQLKLVGNLKGQSSTSTILIQTSQGVIATTPLTSSSSSQVGSKSKVIKSSLPAVMSTALSPSKTATIQVAQAVPQPQNKLIVQKVKSSGPNILQKTQRKPIQRNKKIVNNQLITSVSAAQNVQTARAPVSVTPLNSTAQDTLILSSASGLPLVGQSSVVQGSQLDPGNQTSYVYLTVDESGNYRPLESTPVVNYEGAAGDSQTLYIDSGTTDLDNIFLAIDDAGNVVNIAQPVQNTYTTESSTTPPSQDILAKALANTQVLQQETITTENNPLPSSVESSMLSGCMFVEPQTQYPQPSLSHSVLETSLTLNQPIMTPLEVPSAVSPRSLDQISTLQSGFLSESSLTSNISANKDKKSKINPSMPLLSEESDCSGAGIVDNKNETVFFTQVGVDGSHAVLTPVTSGSQLAFQLALDDNNVIVSSTPGGMPSLGIISSASMPSPSSVTYVSQSEIPASDNDKKLINVSNSSSSTVFPDICQESSIENYHLTHKLLGNQQEIIPTDKTTAGSDRDQNLVKHFSEDPVSSSSAFEIKDVLKPKDVSDINEGSITGMTGTLINEHDETILLTNNDICSGSSNVSSVPLDTKSADNYSVVCSAEATSNDQRVLNLDNPANSSMDNELVDSKTDVTAIREESFCDVLMTDTSVVNGKRDVIETSKRHVDVARSTSIR